MAREFACSVGANQLSNFCNELRSKLCNFRLVVAAPLDKLLKKETPWYWDKEQQLAFDNLKRRCALTPVLAIPSQDAEIVLRCDASREAMGVALYHQDDKGFLQPIEFKSKAFNEAQKRLAAHDREGLALLYALNVFQTFCINAQVRGANR